MRGHNMRAHHTFKCNLWKVLLAVKIKKKIKEKGKKLAAGFDKKNTLLCTLNLDKQ